MAIYSEFSHQKWWFPIAMLVYQRVGTVHEMAIDSMMFWMAKRKPTKLAPRTLQGFGQRSQSFKQVMVPWLGQDLFRNWRPWNWMVLNWAVLNWAKIFQILAHIQMTTWFSRSFEGWLFHWFSLHSGWAPGRSLSLYLSTHTHQTYAVYQYIIWIHRCGYIYIYVMLCYIYIYRS